MQDNVISVNIEIAIGEEPISLIGKQLSIILASTTKGVEKITNWTIDEEKQNVIKFNIELNNAGWIITPMPDLNLTDITKITFGNYTGGDAYSKNFFRNLYLDVITN